MCVHRLAQCLQIVSVVVVQPTVGAHCPNAKKKKKRPSLSVYTNVNITVYLIRHKSKP